MDDVDTESLYRLDELLKNADPDKMPTRKEILEMLESADLSEEMKENIKNLMIGDAPKLFGGFGGGTTLGILFAFIIFSIIFYVSYKLYKSITDKVRKREEKKKAKQMKKKK